MRSRAQLSGGIQLGVSAEVRLLGLGEQKGHQAPGQQQGRHQEDGHGAVTVHQAAEHHVPRDGRHAPHPREEAQRRGPVKSPWSRITFIDIAQDDDILLEQSSICTVIYILELSSD